MENQDIWPAPDSQESRKRYTTRWALLIAASSVAALGIVAIGVWLTGALSTGKDKSVASSESLKAATNYPETTVTPNSLPPLVSTLSTAGSQLLINGQAKISGGLVVTPSTAPSSPSTGEIYYDQTTNQPYYYDGTNFVSMKQPVTALQPNVTSLSVSLQASTPGTAQTGNFNISGTGIAGTIIANSLSGNGSGVTNVNALTLQGNSAAFFTNASNISSGVLADARLSTNVALLNADNTFTGHNLFKNGADATTAFRVQNSAGNGVFGVDTVGGLIDLGSASAINGQIVFQNSANGNTATVESGATSSNYTTVLPTAVGAVGQCLSVISVVGSVQNLGYGVCAGGGSSITGSGTANTIALFTSGTTIGDSILTQSGSTVTAAGTVSATTFTGDGSGLTNLNATNLSSGTVSNARLSINVTLQGNTFNGANQLVQLNGTGGVPALNGSLLTSLNASNIASGTLADGRLSANVPLLNGNNNFTGATLQHNGNNVCDASGNCSAAGSAGGDLTGTYPNPTIAKLQGTTITISSLASGNFLQYNGTNWVNQSMSGDVTVNGSGVATIGNGAVTNAKLQNSSLTVTAGTNLTGGGAVSLGGSVTLNVASSPTFSGTLTVQGAGGVSVGSASNIGKVSFLDGTSDGFVTSIQTAVQGNSVAITIPADTNATDTVCLLTLSNCAASGSAGGDLTGSYPNPTIAKLQGTTLSVSSLTSGDLLLYNGTNWVNRALSGDITVNGSGVATIGNGTVTNAKLQNSSVTVTAGTNLTGGGAVSLGGSVTVSVTSSPTFSGNLTVQGASGVTIGSTTNLGVLSFLDGTSDGFKVNLETATQANNVTLSIPADTNTTDTVCLLTLANCVGTGGGISGSGSSGTIAMFTGSSSIGNSALTQASGNVTASGNFTVQGGTISVGVASTTRGALTLYNTAGSHKFTLQAPSSDPATDLVFTLPSADGSNGDCLQTNGSGGLTFTSCTGGAGGGVTSLDGRTGVLTLSNSSGSGGTITLDTATGAQAGIVSTGAQTFGGTKTFNGGLTVPNGQTFTNAGSTLNTAVSISDLPTGGNIGTAAATVDGATTFNVNQTTAGQALTLPNPTAATAGRIVYVNNVGSASFTMYSATIPTGEGRSFEWNGSAWTLMNNVNAGSGLSRTGNTLSVTYGSGANTAVQGNTTLVCPSGTGNLTGGGNTITIGSGGTCNSLTIVNGPTFSGNLTVQGSGGVTVGVAGTTAGVLTLANGTNTNLSTLQAAAPSGTGTATYTLPSIVGGSSANVCLDTGNCSTSGAAGGDLTGTYPNPTIAKLQGTTITISSLTSGDLLQYNGTNWVNQALSGDITVNGSGVTTIGNAKVTNAKLQNSSLTVTAGTNLTGGGAVSLGGSVTLNVASSPTFSGSVTVQGGSGITVGVAGATAGVLTLANGTNTNLSTIQASAPSGTGTATYSLPSIAGGSSDTICVLTTANCSASGSAGGDLTGSYPNPTIAKLQGTTVSISSLASGNFLQYNGTNWVNQSMSGDVTVNGSGVATIANAAVTNAKLQNSSLTVTAGTNLTGGGSVSLGGSVTLNVASSPSFSGTLTVQGSGGITVGVAGTTAGALNLANGTNSNLSKLQSTAPSGSGTATYSLPSIAGGSSDTVCLLTLANCIGTGGGAIGGSGTAGKVALFTGSGFTIGDSIVTQSSGNLALDNGASRTLNIASDTTGRALTIQGGAATSGTNVGGNLILQGGAGASTGASGSVIVKSNTNNSTTAFQVQNASGSGYLTVDTTSTGLLTSAVPLRLSGTATDTFTTPVGNSKTTKINIPLYDPGAFNGVISLGLASSANGSARLIQAYDARTVTSEPVIVVASPDENNVFGLGWNGTNSTAYLEATGGGGAPSIVLSSHATAIATFDTTLITMTSPLTLSGTGQVNYTSPGGATIATKINIPNFNPGTFAQIQAMGLPSSAPTSARVITFFDQRASTHQPSIDLFSPNENEYGGLSWDGANTVLYLKSSQGITLGTGDANTNTHSALAIDTNQVSSFTPANTSGDAFKITNNSLSTTGSNLANLTFTNNNGSGSTVNGLTITENAAANSADTSNLINLTSSATGTINGINLSGTSYSNLIQNANFKVTGNGDLLSGFTQLDGSTTTNGTGTSSTSMVLTSATNFDVGNYIKVVNATTNCAGSIKTCYAKITAIASNTLTISPALSWDSGSAVTEWHIPEVGGDDSSSQALTSRYGRGYFIDGVVTGNGSTYFTDQSLVQNNSGSTFNFLSNGNTSTLNLGDSGTTVNILGNLTVATTNPFTLGVAGSSTGRIVLNNATNTNTVTLQPDTTSANYTLTLPPNAGSNGQILTTNGSGVLTWSTPGACADCVLNDSAVSDATNTIAPTNDVTSLTLRQTSNGSPTKNIFAITNSGNTTTYASLGSDATWTLNSAASKAFSIQQGGNEFLGISTAGAVTLQARGTNQALALQSSGTGAINLTSAATSGNAASLTADSVNTGNGLAVSLNALTTGKGLSISSTSGSVSSGIFEYINHTATYTTTTTNSGNLLNLNRNLTVNGSSQTLTLSGAVAGITSNCTVTVGTCTDTSNLLALTQSYASASGAVLTVGNSGTGTGINISNGTGAALAADSTTASGTGSTFTFNSLTSGTGLNVSSSSAVTGALANFNATGLTTGTGVAVHVDGVTTGTGLGISSTSTALTSGKLLTLDHTATYVTSPSYTGNLLNINRNLTASGSGHTITLTGSLASLTSNCQIALSGVCTDSSNVLTLTQSYASNSGNVLSVSNSGTGTGVNISNGTGSALAATSTTTTGTGSSFTSNSLSTGTGLLVQSTSNITGAGKLFNVQDNSLTTGTLANLSATGITTGSALNVALGTAITNSNVLSVTGAKLTPTNGNDSSLLNLDFTAANTSGAATSVNGLRVHTTLNSSVAAGNLTSRGIWIQETDTTCGGATCTMNGLQVDQDWASGSNTSNAILVNGSNNTDSSATVNGINIADNGAASTSTNNQLLISVFGTGSGGISSGIRISPPGANVGAGTQYGIKIDNATSGAATQDAVNIGSGWDNVLNVNSGQLTIKDTGVISVGLDNTATTNGLCHSGANVDTATNTTRDIVACSGAPADIAEWYETTGIEQPGDVVAVSDQTFTYQETQSDPFTGEILPGKITRTIAKAEKASSAYQKNILGVVSTSPYQVFGDDIKDQGAHPRPIALAGRVPVKVSVENGAIVAGDYLTASATKPGYAMRATQAGEVIGIALSSTDADGEVVVFVKPSWFDPAGQASGLQQTNNNVQQNGDASLASLNVGGLSTLTDLKVTGSATVARLTVTGVATFRGNIVVNGHVITGGNVPTTTTLAAAGVDGQGANDSICSVSGNDTSGMISLTAGTNDLADGAECKITFANGFDSAPKPVFSPTGQLSVDAGIYVKATATDMTVYFSKVPQAHQVYSFDYWNPQ